MKEIVQPLIVWYTQNKRCLPWRKDKDPYHVWISEIMLQQTRIEAVKEYYQRFIKRLPTIYDLSCVNDDELLKLWEGLGYYNRARNLKKAAIKIMEEYDGIFPGKYREIINLPGIGEYTAGAISSICFQEKEVAVDGNVMRVYSRVNSKDIDVSDLKTKHKIGEELEKILPDCPGDFNEGIMELGETICLPNAMPKCDICPLASYCKAHLSHTEMNFPRKVEKPAKLEENYTIFLFLYDNKVALHKRNSGLLKDMWEFPNKEGFYSKKKIEKWLLKENILGKVREGIQNVHIFTHKKWNMKSYIVELNNPLDKYVWVSLEELKLNYALPTAFMPFFKFLDGEKK